MHDAIPHSTQRFVSSFGVYRKLHKTLFCGVSNAVVVENNGWWKDPSLANFNNRNHSFLSARINWFQCHCGAIPTCEPLPPCPGQDILFVVSPGWSFWALENNVLEGQNESTVVWMKGLLVQDPSLEIQTSLWFYHHHRSSVLFEFNFWCF